MAGAGVQAGGAPVPVGSNLTLRRHVGPEGGVLQLKGHLDRTFDGGTFVDGLHTAALIDLDGITGIENAALPLWSETMRALEPLDVAFVRAPTTLMMQFNNAPGFAGSGQLISGYASYLCSGCGGSQDVLLDFRVVRPEPGPDGLVRVPCARCKELTRGAEEVRRYFRFVRSNPAPVASAGITKLLELIPEHITATRACRRIELERRPGVSGLWLSGPLSGELSLGPLARVVQGSILISAREVTGADADGVRSLLDFLLAQKACTLAEVPPPLIRPLARDPRAGKRSLASVWLPFDCLAQRGHRFEAPVDGEALAAFQAGEEITCACPQCGQPAAAGTSRELPGLLARLTFARPARLFLDFLAAHPAGIDRSAPELANASDDEGESTQMGPGPSAETYSGSAPARAEPPVLDPAALAAEPEEPRAEMLAQADDEEEVLAKGDDAPAQLVPPPTVEPEIELTPARPVNLSKVPKAPARAPGRPKPTRSDESEEEVTPQPDQPLPKREVQVATTSSLPSAPAAPAAPAAPPTMRHGETTEPERPMPPTNLERFGNYEVLEFLGQGGMADVVLARQSGPGGFVRKVALKRILPHHARNPEFVEMFLREARVAAQLNHPNVVSIYEFGEHSGRYFMAIEYVRGWDLQGVLKLLGQLGEPMPVALACRIIADLCAGLASAHNHLGEDDRPAPIIHRDISPHNVLISDRGIVKLADFGIAKDAQNDAHTRADMVKGKTAYLAPERIIGGVNPLDVRPDIFAVGIVLHQCLTGEHPFLRDNDLATMKALLDEAVPPVRRKRPEATRGIDFALAKALVKDPTRRYSSAIELRDALEKEIIELGVKAGPDELGMWVRSIQERGKSIPAASAGTPKHTPSQVSRPALARPPIKAETGPKQVPPGALTMSDPKVKTGPKVPAAPAPALARPPSTPVPATRPPTAAQRPPAPAARPAPAQRPPMPLPSLMDDEEEERTMIDPRPDLSKSKPPRR